MITLFRAKTDPGADRLEETFRRLVLAYQTETLPDGRDFYIRDGNKIFSGKKEVDVWLAELEADLSWQRSISGDGCYIDPKTGKIC